MVASTYQPFKDAISSSRTTSLGKVGPPLELLQIQILDHLLHSHRARNILLVRKDQQQRILHLRVVQNPPQLELGLGYPRPVARVHDEDETLGASIVVPPQWTDLVLTADVPHVELGILVSDGLDVEADGRDGGYILVELEFVKNG